MSRSSRMLVKAGIIPKHTLQQLALWRLVPEYYVELHGATPVSLDTGKEEDVDKFVQDLGAAITKDMAEIKETELDKTPGSYMSVQLRFNTGRVDNATLLVDLLGRLVVPVDPQWKDLESAVITSDEGVIGPHRKVVRQETRYRGDIPSSQVIYLEQE
jgi:hypothetical protein